jgi:hypothetical protein
MIKLDFNESSFQSTIHAQMERESVRRLSILVPTGIEYSIATKRILEIARASGIATQLLGLCRDEMEEPGLRRELVTLSALLANAGFQVEIKIETGKNWLQFIQHNYCAGDIIVCPAEPPKAGLSRPLDQVLASKLDAPIYILSGLYPPSQPRSKLYSRILSWAGSIGIIAGAFLLQVQILSMAKDWAQTTLLILSAVAEVWLISVWNGLLG